MVIDLRKRQGKSTLSRAIKLDQARLFPIPGRAAARARLHPVHREA
jgi:hypothetical protein